MSRGIYSWALHVLLTFGPFDQDLSLGMLVQFCWLAEDVQPPSVCVSV